MNRWRSSPWAGPSSAWLCSVRSSEPWVIRPTYWSWSVTITPSAQPPWASNAARAWDDGVSTGMVRGRSIRRDASQAELSGPSSTESMTSRVTRPTGRPSSTTARAESVGFSRNRSLANAMVAVASIGKGRSAQSAIVVIGSKA